MSSIEEFLAARLAELDEDVRALAADEARNESMSPVISRFTDGHTGYIMAGFDVATRGDVRPQAEIRFDRVLHDVRAKQMLIREYQEAAVQDPRGERARVLGQVVRYHAATYQDHPDYKEEWAP